MAATAQMADYILAPKICLEREDVTLLTDIWYDKPYSQYTRAVVEARSDEIEEWQFFWEMGKRMGLQLMVNDEPVDMQTMPEKLDLLKTITRGSRVPVEAIRDQQGGHVQDVDDMIALPADPETRGHLQLFPPGLDQELHAAFGDMSTPDNAEYPHLLVSRRMKYTHNSTGPEFSLLRAKNSHNPAYIHSADMAALNIADGDVVTISSLHGNIPAVAASSDDVKPGVVSMAHSWGGTPDPAAGVDQRVREMGSNTNRLIDNRERTEKYSAMPRLSTVAVKISK
jgi:anaerobic selenocysteine-containing dehydrogenase